MVIRTVVSGWVLLAGMVMPVGVADDAEAGTAPGEVRVCDRYFWCTVLPPATSCSPIPLPDIGAVENRSADVVELYDDDCMVAVMVVMPGSIVSGNLQVSAYRMR